MEVSWTLDLEHMTDQIAALGPMIVLIAIILGVVMVAMALVKFARMNSGQRAANPGNEALTASVMLVVGAGLVSLGLWLDIGSTSIGATNDYATEARSNVFEGGRVDAAGAGGIEGDASAKWSLPAAINFAATVIAVVGLVGFIRGWMQLVKLSKGSAGQGESFGGAMVFIVGGLLAINIPWTIDVVARTMGVTIGGFGG